MTNKSEKQASRLLKSTRLFPKKQNKVKPTPRQRKAFENIERGLKLKDAMIEAGYSKSTATHPKQNLVENPGFKNLIQEYREDLKKAGVSSEVLAEIQAEGLFDQDAKVRLDYLKETKKDLGINQDQDHQVRRRLIAEEFFKDND